MGQDTHSVREKRGREKKSLPGKWETSSKKNETFPISRDVKRGLLNPKREGGNSNHDKKGGRGKNGKVHPGLEKQKNSPWGKGRNITREKGKGGEIPRLEDIHSKT